MVEVTTLDLVIIGLYLLFMLLVGVWFVKRIKNTDDYYVAGRTLGPVVLSLAAAIILMTVTRKNEKRVPQMRAELEARAQASGE